MVKVLLMRHAESIYNKVQSDYNTFHNITDPKFEYLPNRYIVNNQIIDSDLSELGAFQSKAVQSTLNSKYPNIKYVWVSPLRRAFNTYKIAFENYINPDHRVIVNPYIREVIWSNSDCAMYTEELQKENPKINFSFMENFEDPKIWWLHTINEQGDTGLKQEMINAWKADPKIESVLKVLEKVYPVKGESVESVTARVDSEKEKLKEFIRRNGVKDEELIVICHSSFLKRWTTTEVDENNEPVKFKWFQNAEIAPFNLV